MTAISSLTDEEVDELLAGHAPDSRRDLAPLAEVATILRECIADEPVPIMRYPLRHAVTRWAAPVEPLRPRRLVHAALGGAAIVLVGLAGAANALPPPVQDAAAEVGDLVGIEVPHADEDTSVDTPGDGGGPARTTASDADDQGGNVGVALPDSTPGGAVPSEPGTAGDQEPATPAIPPEPEVEGDGHSAVANPNAAEGGQNGSRSEDPTDATGAGDDDAEEPRIVDDAAGPVRTGTGPPAG